MTQNQRVVLQPYEVLCSPCALQWLFQRVGKMYNYEVTEKKKEYYCKAAIQFNIFIHCISYLFKYFNFNLVAYYYKEIKSEYIIRIVSILECQGIV